MSKTPLQHKLLKYLGPEPLTEDFTGKYLYTQSRNRRIGIKTFIMQSQVVVGVGNIYASEALYDAGIHPLRTANKISLKRYQNLVDSIKYILNKSIQAGGTTLKDFVNSDGKPGYFKQALKVYGRAAEACLRCGKSITSKIIGQRNTFYCTHCQK